MKKFMEKYQVSRETFERLKLYQSLLVDWQKKFNLVSNSSIENAWVRHFEDSVQLFQYIPQGAESLVDFGSGAGFPGMVLAVVASEKTPYLNVSLVESVKKKTVYLNEVADKTGTDVEIINDRIENLSSRKFDVVTSRAMTSLSKLLDYTFPFCHAKTLCIFPKGRSYAEELSEAHKKWKFKCDIKPNLISEEGKILIITNISKKKERKNAKNISRS